MAASTVVTINDTTAVSLASGMGVICLTTPYGMLIGGSNLSAANGFHVPSGVVFPVPGGLGISENLYGMSAGGGAPASFDVNVLKTTAI